MNNHKKGNIFIWVGILILVLLATTGVVYLNNRYRKNAVKKQSNYTDVLSPTSVEPSLTVEPTLSADDSVDTLKDEVDQTTVDDFSQDLNDIDQDLRELEK